MYTEHFYWKAAFRYLFPYLLFGEILYLALKGARDGTNLIFRGLLYNISSVAQYIGLAIDILFILVGVSAIIYGIYCLYQKGLFGKIEQAVTYGTETELSQKIFGGEHDYKTKTVETSTTDVNKVRKNVGKGILYFFVAIFIAVFGPLAFPFIVIKHASAKKK